MKILKIDLEILEKYLVIEKARKTSKMTENNKKKKKLKSINDWKPLKKIKIIEKRRKIIEIRLIIIKNDGKKTLKKQNPKTI